MGRMYRTIVSLLLLTQLLSVGCAEGEDEPPQQVDPRIEQIRSTTRILFDSGSPQEQVYIDEEARKFLERFEVDTFNYGPTQVRLVNNCRGGTIRIGKDSYLFSLCSIKATDQRKVFAVAMGNDVIRLVEKGE